MAEAAVIMVLGNLRELMSEHMDVFRGVEEELKQLEGVLQMLGKFLQEQQHKGESRRRLEMDREIRDLVYDAEDVIDTFLTRAVTTVKFKNRRPKIPNVNCYGLTSTKLNVESVTEDVRTFLKKAPAAGVQVPEIEHKRNSSLKEISTVVGIEDEVANILEYLKEESEDLDVISIVGVPGIGKTTLASKIYGHPTIKSTFSPMAFWVTVSQEFSTKDVFASVFQDLDEKTMPPPALTDSMLADIIRHRLGNSRFLMVVDGVHTIDDWRAVEISLPKTNRFGKVLLTAHDEKLARQANPKRDPHMLRSLDSYESLELFKSKIFGEPDKCPPHLETLADEIISKCGGLPLAIVSIAGKFSQEKLSWIDEWEKVRDGVDTYLSENQESSMKNIIEMSYNELPIHLRPCFLYLGMFPEDTKIPAWKLVRLWIAEGFIEINPRKSLEEVAENYLQELINRNLLIVDETKAEGGIKTCRISKMIRELCKRQAAFEEPNMFKDVHPGDYKIGAKCRRICVHSNDHVVDFLGRNPYGEVVRSFLCFSKESTDLPAECTQSIPRAFKLLRVLEANPIKFRKFPRARLIHLRYIAISGERINSLPRTVSYFWSLQTVVINTKSPTFNIKASVWKMMRVRHLKTKAAIVINKVAQGKAAKNLQTLSRLAVQCVTEDFCRRASNLKKLGIRGQLKHLLEGNCLSRLDRVRKLKLVHDVHPRAASEDPLISLPPRKAFPPNLVILEMSSTFMEWSHMATLGTLPVLEVLKLKEHAFVGKEWNAVGNYGFRYLEVLLIATTDLEVWTVSGDPFPALINLVIRNCDKLTGIPPELKNRVQVVETESPVHYGMKRITDIQQHTADESVDANVPLGRGREVDTEATMAEPAISFLVENVQKMLAVNKKVFSDSSAELRQLQNELKLMEALLMTLANKREKEEVFRQLERQIRQVVYAGEDILDACLLQFVVDKYKPTFQSLGPRRLYLAQKVKAFREKEVQPVFDLAFKNFTTLLMVDVTARAEKKLVPLFREDDIVGFGGEAYTLIRDLLEDEYNELKVISITGMGGLGKTTLARMVFCSPRVIRMFDYRIWVNVSQDYNLRDVFLSILKQFTKEDLSRLDENELAPKVRSCLEKESVLIILDDVWNGEAWSHIKAALPMTNRYGKVLITSRDERVGWKASKREPHRLRFLQPEESWELLQIEVFSKLRSCPEDLKVVGRHIAMQCGGLPLALVVMGEILADKLNRSRSSDVRVAWENVSANVNEYLQRRTEDSVFLSYYKLPNHLRNCFLYLGMFPEDSEISARMLTHLWIAEGFIEQKLEMSLEEVAEEYLEELITRNLVMVDKTKANGQVKTCRIHGTIREFCKTQALFGNQNLFQEVKKTKEGNFYPPVSVISQCRRLCAHSRVAVDFLRQKPKCPKARSFLCFSKEAIILQPEYTTLISDAFNVLRVLDANPIKFTEFPTKFTKLVHLRYIALSGDQFKSLPAAATKLWNLQTIRINTLSPTFEIKANIWNMMQLRHFKTKAAIIITKDARGRGGQSLQTLTRLSDSAQCCWAQVFNKASNLKNLGIRGRLTTLLDSGCLARLHSLQKLKLVYDVFKEVITSHPPLSSLPSSSHFPPKLRILKLSRTFLDWKHIAPLGELPFLEVLKLNENAFMGKVWEAISGSFPSLEVLHIAGTDLEIWTAQDQEGPSPPFPKLRCLVLNNCERLKRIPSVLEKTLESLDIQRVTKSIVLYAKEMEKTKRGGFKLRISPGDEI